MDNITTDLDNEEKDILRRLQEIKLEKQRKIEENNKLVLQKMREDEISKPVILTVEYMAGSLIYSSLSFGRPDVVDIFRSIPSRAYKFDQKQNSVPISEWRNLTDKLREIKGISFEWGNKEVKEKIEWHLNTPKYLVSLQDKQFKVVLGPESLQYILYKIPGSILHSEKFPMFYTIPLTEGWNLYAKLEKEHGTVWEENAKEFVVSHMERRGKADEIAKLEEGIKFKDYSFDGNGVYKLQKFQEVAAEFADVLDGKVLFGDVMGLGKTWEFLALLKKNGWRGVIIVPASIKPKWIKEVEKLLGVIPYVPNRTTPDQSDMEMMLIKKPQITIFNYDLIARETVTEKEYMKGGMKYKDKTSSFMWIQLINMSKPDIVGLDEAHYIKNVDSGRSMACGKLNCSRIAGMTGTPVLNRPGELWRILNLISPSLFPYYETFLKQYTYDGKAAKNVEELRNLLKGIMIRRTKKDVMSELPPINRITQYHELSEKAEKLYDKVLQGVYESVAEMNAGGIAYEKAVTNILVQIQRLKMVCSIDKVEQVAEMAVEMYEQAGETDNKKVIVFSQYKAVAYRIGQLLGHEALCFVSNTRKDFVTAKDQERFDLVQQFQTDPKVKYLVATEKTLKEGLDATAAGSIIFADLFWTPAGHDQAEGRAYGRMDNPHSIDSYYLLAQRSNGNSTIDAWIWELLAFKAGVINEVVEGIENERDSSILKGLIDKLKEDMWTRK